MIAGSEEMLSDHGEPGVAELRSVLDRVLDGARPDTRFIGQEVLKEGKVYRLHFGGQARSHSVIVKRLDLPRAQRNRLVADRWLPAVGMAHRGPRLLGVAAERGVAAVWHVYEDFGDRILDTAEPDWDRVEAAIELVAALHVRFAGHPFLPEARMFGKDMGADYYLSNVRDAIRGLESLRPPAIGVRPADEALRDRLLERLYRLRDEGPDRARLLQEVAGPETLLHGDLWPANIVTVPTPDGLRTRLIDWDATGVGPPTYDLSTFVYRFPHPRRPWILDRYQEAVGALGWRLPPTRELSLLLETAELSRIANCIVWPCVHGASTGAAWSFDALAEIETWFEPVEPALPGG